MEKILLANELSTRWTDPGNMTTFACIGTLVFQVVTPIILTYFFGWYTIPIPFALQWLWYNFIYMRPRRANTSKYIKFNDKKMERHYAEHRIPISTLYQGYIEGKLDFKGDCYEILAKHRYEFVNFKLTFTVCKWLMLQLFPNHQNSTMKDQQATKKEIAEHYDRGNDFFNAFLGPSMVYTSGIFHGLEQGLEKAQENKMDLICEKLALKEGQTLLDIGCGWGTLVRHAAKNFGVHATGVTLSKEGAAWCNENNEKEGLVDSTEILEMDYRDIPTSRKFDGVSSIEMAEHVGIKNFQVYLGKVRSLLKDEGSFLMQVAGLRQGSNWEDLAWGLFMGHYIFPGADASTPLNWYIKQVERAGFEVQSVETIGRHYSHTLHRWYLNFESNKDEMRAKYGDSLCRLWTFFLAWATIASGMGTATCYQIQCHKNLNKWNRDQYVGGVPAAHGIGVREGGEAGPVGAGAGAGVPEVLH